MEILLGCGAGPALLHTNVWHHVERGEGAIGRNAQALQLTVKVTALAGAVNSPSAGEGEAEAGDDGAEQVFVALEHGGTSWGLFSGGVSDAVR
jgi:hypothetical protein